jgi:TRAP transporter TAXI family solute receptor
MVGWSEASAEEGHVLTVGSGEVSGVYFPEAGAICRLVNKDRQRHGLRCLVEVSAGSAANLASLRSGDDQLAIVQSKVLAQAVGGTGPFAKDPFPDLRSLMSLHGEALVVLVAPTTKIKTLADLKGKRLNLGHAGSYQRIMADALLNAEGITANDLSAVLEMDLPKISGALCRNEIDAAVVTGLHPIAEVQEAIDDCGATLLPLKDAALDGFLKSNPIYVRQILTDDTYPGLAAKVPCFGLASVLVTTVKLSAADAYEVVKAVYENFSPFKAMHPLLGGLDKKQMAHDALVAPLHDGARRYYRENGLQ